MTQQPLITPERFCSFCGTPTSQPPYKAMEICEGCAEVEPRERVRRRTR